MLTTYLIPQKCLSVLVLQSLETPKFHFQTQRPVQVHGPAEEINSTEWLKQSLLLRLAEIKDSCKSNLSYTPYTSVNEEGI